MRHPPLGPGDRSRDFLLRWRAVQAEPTGLRPVRVALAASFTLEPLLPYLGCFLAQRGLLARFALAPFGQIYQALLDPASVGAAEADITVVLPRLEDLCARQLDELDRLRPDAVERARAACHAELERLCQALAERERRGGLLLCGTLPMPPHTPLGVLDASHPASRSQLLRELNLRLFRQATSGRMRLFDLDGAVAAFGTSRAYDERLGHLARCPFSDEFLRALALSLSRSIAPLFCAPAKVIAVDLDNTLWGGIVGEDGPHGIQLGPDGAGAAFVAFQEALRKLRDQGVLLCIASKNNEADAFEVIDHHPEMRLRRSHFSAWRIGWQDKATSLRQLAEELSLGLDSFVLIDDSGAECEQVRCALPQVTVLQLPPDPACYVAALRGVAALDRMSITAEDQQRADSYSAERARRAAMAQIRGPENIADFLRSLELHLTVHMATAEQVPRLAQLTQKTNQFNLTTVRRSEADIAQLLADPGHRLYAAEVRDRFGDYGLTGLAIVRRQGQDSWEIDTLLLSCRVLGRRVESGVLRVVLDDLAALGARRLRGRFIPTAKNEPARSFYPDHGFRDEGGGCYVLEPLTDARCEVSHMTIERRGGGAAADRRLA
ncbi:MAG: HAD-IIIC family phosphatase [Myxococcota bacterium]|nr:HAD-IIIC family phosphatase [Myxococcota bacterium]